MKTALHANLLFCACLLGATPPVPAADGGSPEESVLAGQAKASVAAFATALQSELGAAMQAGGPLAAIEVCHVKAPAIAQEITAQQGVQVARVSQRNRNPDNAPNDWQAEVLEDFQARLAAGADPAALAWHEIAATDDGREFRFMKAIPTQPLCLACHGESLAPQVSARIEELYPEDRATGFREGDLRGAFVVTRSLE